MDRVINVKVGGNYISKDNKNAGVRGEANVTYLRITFDDSWIDYAKKVTFWDALGRNPVERTLTLDLCENIADNTTIYLVPIPGEPLAEAGTLTFVIDGYIEGKRQRSMSDKLEVKDAPIADNAGEPTDPTPTPAEQWQEQIENLAEDIAVAYIARDEAGEYAKAAENAKDSAEESAEKAESAVGKTSYIGANGNWYAWDGETEEFYDTGVRAQGQKGDKGDTGAQGVQGEQGIQGIPGKDGYTPQKGVDYFTAQDIKSLGIDDKVDKVDGKELSTNDFTDELKKRVEENTFDGLITMPEDSSEIDYDQYTTSGIYKVYSEHDDDQIPFILIVNRLDRVVEQTETDGAYAFKRVKDENGKWTNWQKAYISQTDLDKKVDKVDGKGLSTNDFTDALKNKLNNIDDKATSSPKVITVDFEQNSEEWESWNDKTFFNQYSNGLYYITGGYALEGVGGDYCESVILLCTNYDDGGPIINRLLITNNGDMYSNFEYWWEDEDNNVWEKVSVSQTDLDNAIGDVETSLENIIAKYGLGGDGV